MDSLCVSKLSLAWRAMRPSAERRGTMSSSLASASSSARNCSNRGGQQFLDIVRLTSTHLSEIIGSLLASLGCIERDDGSRVLGLPSCPVPREMLRSVREFPGGDASSAASVCRGGTAFSLLDCDSPIVLVQLASRVKSRVDDSVLLALASERLCQLGNVGLVELRPMLRDVLEYSCC